MIFIHCPPDRGIRQQEATPAAKRSASARKAALSRWANKEAKEAKENGQLPAGMKVQARILWAI
jgi:hypothetical protein